MEDPRIRKFAKFLINFSVNLKKGEKILIELHGEANELAKALIEEAYAVGGLPLFHKFDYTLEGAIIKGTTLDHMKAIAAYELKRMQDMDAYIDIRASANINEWNDINNVQMDIYKKEYWGPIHLKQRCNNTKWSVIRYPNPAMAQLAHMSTAEYEDFYFKACLTDYEKMNKAIEPLANRMAKTDMVRILGPKTDISFSIKNIGRSGDCAHFNVPDGEIATAPVKDSVNGVIYYNIPSPYSGEIFSDVTLEFKNGKIINATSNLTERINQILDTDEGARYIGEFAIGFNPYITKPILDILFDEKMAGSFHLTPGNCYDLSDNGNHSAQHWDLISCQMPEWGGGEIWFDDELIRKDGLFVPEYLHQINPQYLR